MKHLKMLGLAVVAAAALTAILGVGTASATTVCTTNTTCPTSHAAGVGGFMWNSGDIITATSTNATLTTNIGHVTCPHSEVKLKLTETGKNDKSAIAGQITALTFGPGCFFGSTPCEVKAVNLPYHATATVGTVPNGSLAVSSGGTGNPGASIICGFFINCTFSNTTITLPVTGGNPATVTANKVPLNRSGGICPTTSEWDATYTTTAATGGVYLYDH